MANVIGGIEGGATHSTLVLISPTGEILTEHKGPGTNYLLLGKTDCWARIAEMVNTAKQKAGISKDEPLKALGLGLSGCEKEESNQSFIEGLQLEYPCLSSKYAIGSDTDGSIAAISNRGGITCIAGTGSNTLLINPDGGKYQCGGYGYLIGDEGSAFKIAHSAIKISIDHLDGFNPSPYPIEEVWSTIKTHFNIETQIDLLEYMYAKFDKSYVASLCKEVARLAENGDALAKHLFEKAGADLAHAILAVLPKASDELRDENGGLPILCVGSVWLSWRFLKNGFVPVMDACHEYRAKLTMMRLKTNAAVGAAYMACNRLKLDGVRNCERNYEIFYRYGCNSIH